MYKIWFDATDHLPKKARFTLGSRIDVTFLNIIELVFTAGTVARDKKIPCIQKALTNLDLLKLLLRIAWEIKALDNRHYLLVSAPLDEIGRMLGGWHRFLRNEATGRGEPRDHSDSSCTSASSS